MYEIAFGPAEQDLFATPGPGHRTYHASDGHTYTGTGTTDVDYLCSPACCDALTADYPVHATGTVHDGWRTAEAAHVFDHGDGRYHDATVYRLDPATVEDRHLPITCAHCDAVIIGPTPPSPDEPQPSNYVITVVYDNGRTTRTPFAAFDAAVTHATIIARSYAARRPSITLATGPDYHGPPHHRRITPAA